MSVQPSTVRTTRRRPGPPVSPTVGRSRDQAVCDFIERYVVVPEGTLVGRPMKLLPEQRRFIRDVYGRKRDDGRMLTRRGILSEPRKNGKTGLVAALMLAHLVGPEAKRNSHIYSAARSREQAALVFNYAQKSLQMSPQLAALTRVQPTGKTIWGLTCGVTYRALSAEATTAYGLSPSLVIHDELGQVVGPIDPLFDALETAGGAHDEPLSLVISTQAPNDADLLSILIDDAVRSGDPTLVCHLYAAPNDTQDIFDEELWKRVNPALGIFRSIDEFREAAERARRLPSFEAAFRNLYLNMRVSQVSLFLAPSVWAENAGAVDPSVFYESEVSIGLDLSARTDLTAAVMAAQDEQGVVHLRPFVVSPADGIEQRARLDRAPYPLWLKQGHMHTTPGKVVDYRSFAEQLRDATEGMNVVRIAFDRWRIDLFRKASEEAGFAINAEWQPVGQGFKDMSPRIENFEKRVLEGTLRHGNHPLLNMAAAGAIAISDTARNRKLEKAKSTARIDPLVAALMAVGAADGIGLDGELSRLDESSLLIVG